MVLEPFQTLMEATVALTLFDFEFQDELGYEQNNYRFKALITKFCSSYQKCQTILHNHNRSTVTSNPDIYLSLKKLQYEGWRKNKVEHYYIKPLQDALLKMRVNLTKCYTLGFDFWKQPLCENKAFL